METIFKYSSQLYLTSFFCFFGFVFFCLYNGILQFFLGCIIFKNHIFLKIPLDSNAVSVELEVSPWGLCRLCDSQGRSFKHNEGKRLCACTEWSGVSYSELTREMQLVILESD